ELRPCVRARVFEKFLALARWSHICNSRTLLTLLSCNDIHELLMALIPANFQGKGPAIGMGRIHTESRDNATFSRCMTKKTWRSWVVAAFALILTLTISPLSGA